MVNLDVVKIHARFFADHGFIFNRSQMIFEKVFSNGRQVISVNLIEDLKESYLEYHLGVRINEIEELIHQYLPTPNNYVDQSITLVQTPDKLGNSYPNKLFVSDVKQLPEIIKSFEYFFLETGFKWLDKMIDPMTLEQEFLHHKEIPMEEGNLVESAFRSTALSRLFNSIDYPILRQSFLEKINSLELTPFAIASFLKFLNYLDKVNLKVV